MRLGVVVGVTCGSCRSRRTACWLRPCTSRSLRCPYLPLHRLFPGTRYLDQRGRHFCGSVLVPLVPGISIISLGVPHSHPQHLPSQAHAYLASCSNARFCALDDVAYAELAHTLAGVSSLPFQCLRSNALRSSAIDSVEFLNLSSGPFGAGQSFQKLEKAAFPASPE